MNKKAMEKNMDSRLLLAAVRSFTFFLTELFFMTCPGFFHLSYLL